MSGLPESPRGAHVILHDLSKEYAGQQAVAGLSLDIAPGEFVTLLGPSGSGKSTTLMMLAGLLTPTSGRVLIDGEDVTDLPAYRRNIGVVFQNYALFPHMSVFDNVAFPLRMRRVPKAVIQKRVTDALHLIKLDGFQDRYPRQLSGGQQQRVALARAIVFEAPLLLMDEPLGALDKNLREHMQFEIRHLQKKLNLTTVYVTHDQSEALTMSDRIVVMNHGTILQAGRPEKIYEHPASRFVADFIGETNLLLGTVVAAAGDTMQVRVDAGIVVPVRAAVPSPVGEEVTLGLRPERISLGPTPGAGAVCLVGRVEEAIYRGADIRYVIGLSERARLVVHATTRSGNVQSGDPVEVSWPIESIFLLKT